MKLSHACVTGWEAFPSPRSRRRKREDHAKTLRRLSARSYAERSGRRKTRPKLEYVRLAAPRCGGLGLSFPRSRARRTADHGHAVVRCLAACLGRNAHPGCIAGLYGRLTVAEPCFQGSGEAVESLLSHATGHDPGRRPCPRSVRYAHRASQSTGHGEFSIAAKGGDKAWLIFSPGLGSSTKRRNSPQFCF